MAAFNWAHQNDLYTSKGNYESVGTFCNFMQWIKKRCHWLTQSWRNMDNKPDWDVRHCLCRDAKIMQEEWMELHCQLNILQVGGNQVSAQYIYFINQIVLCESKVQKKNLAEYKIGRIQLSAPKQLLNIESHLWQRKYFCCTLSRIKKRCHELTQSWRRSMDNRPYWDVRPFLCRNAKITQKKWMQPLCVFNPHRLAGSKIFWGLGFDLFHWLAFGVWVFGV